MKTKFSFKRCFVGATLFLAFLALSLSFAGNSAYAVSADGGGSLFQKL